MSVSPLTRDQYARIEKLFFRVYNHTNREAVVRASVFDESFHRLVDYSGNGAVFTTNLITTAFNFSPRTLGELIRGCDRYVGDNVAADFADILAHLEGTSTSLLQNAAPPFQRVSSSEATLIPFLEGLTSSDFETILVRLPETTGHIPEKATHVERVAALMRYMRSTATGGQGVERLLQVVKSLFPV